MTDLRLSCQCGALRGLATKLTPTRVIRAVCYCADCQNFAWFLGQEHRVLDHHGGTEIYQMSPRRLAFSQGVEHLACVRLRPKGLYRWYANCCRSPVANTIGGGFAFAGLISPILQNATEDTTGPVRTRIYGRDARGDVSQLGTHRTAPLSLMFPIVRSLLLRRLRGEHKRSPFFDPASGQARVKPRLLTLAELADVDRRRQS